MTAATGGEIVWRGMTQAELDAAYTQAAYATNRQQILDRYAANSELTRARLGPPTRLAYGSGAREGMDLYPAPGEDAPISVFIHGGAWRAGMARDYAFPAETFVAAGAHFVVPDFDWVQDRAGELMPIADQIRGAITWVSANARTFGGDPDRLYLSAHSSGAHMAAVALTAEALAGKIKGALLSSGMYDLEAVRLSARSDYVRFTDESEQALSPERHLEGITAPVILAHGSLETPEFQRHTRDFLAALTAAGKPSTLLVGEGYNHFEILETLANPQGLLGRAALAQMGLGEP